MVRVLLPVTKRSDPTINYDNAFVAVFSFLLKVMSIQKRRMTKRRIIDCCVAKKKTSSVMSTSSGPTTCVDEVSEGSYLWVEDILRERFSVDVVVIRERGRRDRLRIGINRKKLAPNCNARQPCIDVFKK